MILRFFIIVFTFFSFLNAKTIEINDFNPKISILEYASTYIDKTSKLEFNEVKKKKFKKLNNNNIQLGYTEDNLWVKFSIKNSSNKKLERYITITNPMLDTIELYTKNENENFRKETQGILHLDKYDRGNIFHSSFKIAFKKNETKKFYYKTHSISSAIYFELFVKDSRKLYEDEFSYQLVESLFFGAMIALVLYNLFIFYFTKDKAYLFYVFFLFFTILNHASYSVMIDYIIGEKYSHIDAFFAVYYLSFAAIFALLFIYEILNIKQYKVLKTIVFTFLFLIISTMIVSTQNNYLIEVTTIISFICMILVLYLAIFSLTKKHPLAKYVFIAWSINTLGLFSLAFKQYGIPNFIDYFPYFFELTSFTEAIIFSVALASKINKTKELEQSVAKNKILTRELHHRVKNNMQFIILMYRLKLANLTTNEIDEKLKETEGSIQAMSQTHEILYNQENLETIDTKLYFENLIDELKRSFDTKNIKIKLEIFATLDTQKAIYCGIILNELITNSFKYAFSKNTGQISISLKKEKNRNIFILKDNGIGFNYKEKKDESFGLSFIEEMVKNELKGNIFFKNQEGTKVLISF